MPLSVVQSLLAELESRGVELRVRGDAIAFHPGSAVPAELREEMKARKAELIEALRSDRPAVCAADTPAESPTPQIDPEKGLGTTTYWNPGVLQSAAPPWCPGYGHRRGWRSIHGPHLICATCGPPASPELVAEWLTAPDG